jgi:hypothetical protein
MLTGYFMSHQAVCHTRGRHWMRAALCLPSPFPVPHIVILWCTFYFCNGGKGRERGTRIDYPQSSSSRPVSVQDTSLVLQDQEAKWGVDDTFRQMIPRSREPSDLIETLKKK